MLGSLLSCPQHTGGVSCQPPRQCHPRQPGAERGEHEPQVTGEGAECSLSTTSLGPSGHLAPMGLRGNRENWTRRTLCARADPSMCEAVATCYKPVPTCEICELWDVNLQRAQAGQSCILRQISPDTLSGPVCPREHSVCVCTCPQPPIWGSGTIVVPAFMGPLHPHLPCNGCCSLRA